MNFIITTTDDDAPKSVTIIAGGSGFVLDGGVLSASVESKDGEPLAINLRILADEIRFKKD